MKVPLNCWCNQDGAHVRYTTGSRARQVWSVLNSRSRGTRVVYINSVFNVVFGVVPLFAQLMRWWRDSEVVVAPRGELDPGALSIKSKKKQRYLRIVTILGLEQRITWHASNEREANNIRTAFPGAKVHVKSNETMLPDLALRPQRDPGPTTFAFLSRVSPKKGLHVLLEALGRVDRDVHLHVFGNLEDEVYRDECNRAVAQLPSHVSVHFRGPVANSDVRATLANYDVFMLPTAGENFGHAIAEALASSCILALPDTTPWSDVARSTGTLVPSLRAEDWTDLIMSLCRMPPDKLIALRQTSADAYDSWRATHRGAPSMLDHLSDAYCTEDTASR